MFVGNSSEMMHMGYISNIYKHSSICLINELHLSNLTSTQDTRILRSLEVRDILQRDIKRCVVICGDILLFNNPPFQAVQIWGVKMSRCYKLI